MNVVLPRSMTGSGIISLTVEAIAGYVNGVGEAATANTVFIDIL